MDVDDVVFQKSFASPLPLVARTGAGAMLLRNSPESCFRCTQKKIHVIGTQQSFLYIRLCLPPINHKEITDTTASNGATLPDWVIPMTITVNNDETDAHAAKMKYRTDKSIKICLSLRFGFLSDSLLIGLGDAFTDNDT